MAGIDLFWLDSPYFGWKQDSQNTTFPLCERSERVGHRRCVKHGHVIPSKYCKKTMGKKAGLPKYHLSTADDSSKKKLLLKFSHKFFNPYDKWLQFFFVANCHSLIIQFHLCGRAQSSSSVRKS